MRVDYNNSKSIMQSDKISKFLPFILSFANSTHICSFSILSNYLAHSGCMTITALSDVASHTLVQYKATPGSPIL